MTWLEKKINHLFNPLHVYCRLQEFIWAYSKWWDKYITKKEFSREDFYQMTKLIRKKHLLKTEKETLLKLKGQNDK